jgi:hypothetical protein
MILASGHQIPIRLSTSVHYGDKLLIFVTDAGHMFQNDDPILTCNLHPDHLTANGNDRPIRTADKVPPFYPCQRPGKYNIRTLYLGNGFQVYELELLPEADRFYIQFTCTGREVHGQPAEWIFHAAGILGGKFINECRLHMVVPFEEMRRMDQRRAIANDGRYDQFNPGQVGWSHQPQSSQNGNAMNGHGGHNGYSSSFGARFTRSAEHEDTLACARVSTDVSTRRDSASDSKPSTHPAEHEDTELSTSIVPATASTETLSAFIRTEQSREMDPNWQEARQTIMKATHKMSLRRSASQLRARARQIEEESVETFV